MTAKERFRELMPKIEALVDKQAALDSIRDRIWPLDAKDKDVVYFEITDDEKSKDLEYTRDLNYYIKMYLYNLIKNG